MVINRLKLLLAGGLLTCCSLIARGQEEIIEHEGNKYIIHVERLNPDKEMTLLDVLHICPELMSTDGKTLTADYLLSVDDICLSIDYEPLLESIKACELSTVSVCTYSAVNNALDGTTGNINLQFKESGKMTGKVGLSGSTYGNGQLYADIADKCGNVTVRALAQTNLQYSKAHSLLDHRLTSRNTVENAMLFIDWQMTEKDLLKLKLSQGYDEEKDRFVNDDEKETSTFSRQRWGELVATYERNLNDHDANLYVETGMNYANSVILGTGLQAVIPWWIAEFGIPLLKQSLMMTVGYEGCYTNLLYKGIKREQSLYNDLYVQFDYHKGPWVISLGDRLRHNHFWDKHYTVNDRTLYSHNRFDHALHASVGYQKGHHFIQGTFCRSYYNPLVSDFYEYIDDGPVLHFTDYRTNLAWRSEIRYTYQAKQFLASGRLIYTLLTDMPIPHETRIGLETSATWFKGPFRLTAGAQLAHRHISGSNPLNDTFFSLKLAPTLLLGKGFRLSSTLIYQSNQDINNIHAHLFASVKINKDLGKRFNLYADFHDIAGPLKGDTYYLMQTFYNRALTIGLTYYPWR